MDTLETTSTNSQPSWWSYPVRTQFTNDLLGTATFTMLPWSTTGFQIILLIWLTGILGVSLREDGAAILLHLRRPHCMFPLLIFVLALAGTAWSEAPWLTGALHHQIDRQVYRPAFDRLPFRAIATGDLGTCCFLHLLFSVDGAFVDVVCRAVDQT
ncbi:hypothetical protein ACVWW6_006868 [Bradyrhizobium sp. USDA 3311]